MTEYDKLTILVTVYKDQIDKVKQFFHAYYPKAVGRISVAHQSKGVNTWKDTNVQFLLASVNFHCKQYYMAAWEWKQIENYWLRSHGEDPDEVNYPHDVLKSDVLPSEEDVLEMKLLVEDKGFHVELPQIRQNRPKDRWHKLIQLMAEGESMQADRLRIYDDSLKILWDCSGRYRPSILYTDIEFEKACFSRVPQFEDTE